MSSHTNDGPSNPNANGNGPAPSAEGGAGAAPAPERREGGERRPRRPRGPRNRDRAHGEGAPAQAAQPAAPRPPRPAPAPRPEEAGLDGQTARALGFVRTLIENMQMNAEVVVAPDDGEGSADEIRLEIEGPDAGRIIGKKGQVLDAIQYLATRVVHRPGDPRRHVSVDAEGYRARHEDQLSEMAKRLAARVAQEGKVITFDPMSARDRRVVHMALRDAVGVRTESIGEDPERRVQIMPVKGPPPPKTP